MNGYPYQPPGPPHGYTPPPSAYQMEPFRRPLKRWANIIGGGLLILEAAMIAVYLLLDVIFSALDYNSLSVGAVHMIDEAVNLAAYVLGFWVAIVFIAALIKIPFSVAFPMRRPKASITIPSVFVALGASIVGSMLVSWLTVLLEAALHVTPIMPDSPIPIGIGANIIYVVSLTVAPAIFEEMLFRGVIMQSLRRFGDGFALAVSAILFGLVHGNLIQGPNAILLGLVIGYFVLRTGSLVPGMVIHFVNNALAVLFTYLLEYMSDRQAEMLNLAVFVVYLAVGALALVFLVVRHGGLFRLAPSDYPLPLALRHRAFFTSVTIIIFLLFIIWMTSRWVAPI